MNPNLAIERALAATQLEEALHKALRGSDPAAARDALARVLVHYSTMAEQTEPATMQAPVAAPTPPPKQVSFRLPPRPPVRPAAPVAAVAPQEEEDAETEEPGADEDVGEGAAHGDKTDTLIQILVDQPRTPIPELADAIYGGRDQRSQKRLRSLLAALKRTGRAMNVAPGQWEVTTKGA